MKMPPKRTKYFKKPQKCFVPSCENVEGCGKIFLHTPRNPDVLKSWCDAVGSHSGGKCCEDHFELAEDAENWQYFKLCGNGLRMKQGVVPHKYLTSKRPDTGSQFSDSDKKLKLEFLSTLVTERKILTRVNRLEDLKVSDGTTNLRGLEELKKTGLAKQSEEEPAVPTLQVTPDIYLCSCYVHENDLPDTGNPAQSHRVSCSTQTPEASEYFILGPTTDIRETEDPLKLPNASPVPRSHILKKMLTVEGAKGGKPKQPKKPKQPVAPVDIDEYLSSSESELSMFDGIYSDEDPEYDPEVEDDHEEGEHEEEERVSEMKEDELIRNALKANPPERRPRKRKSPAKGGKTKIASKSKTRQQSKKPTGNPRGSRKSN